MNCKKIIPKILCGDNLLEHNGARLGDGIAVRPMQGRKKEISLNRREIEIKSSFNMGCIYEKNVLSIPRGRGDFSFSLYLCDKEGKIGEDISSRYLLRSNSSLPFKINGTFSFEAFIERGDIIDLAYNRISVFKKPSLGVFPLIEDRIIIDSGLDVLIEGETGTGKSRLAKEIHQKSNPNGNFVHVNLSAFSIGLIESELFGHVKGAFTGAIIRKRGAFLEASGGTLFLDEIDSLPLEIQTKLLLFLDNKEIRAVGGGALEKVNLRIVFATGQNLKKLVKEGKMRKDFYYRITSGIKINLKPLRRDSDLLYKICDDFSLSRNIFITPKLMEFYKNRSWPGNIRQLLGHLEKKAAFIKGNKMEFDHIEEELLVEEEGLLPFEQSFLSLEDIKHQYVYKVFNSLDGNYAKCAKVLGISTNTVRGLLNQYQSIYAANMS